MVRPSRRTVLLGGAAASMIKGFCRSKARVEASARPSLPIPPELRANAKGMVVLDARPGSMRFQNNYDTAIYGINGPYLGPAVRVRRGEKVVAQVRNSVPENITMHWHGLIIPGAADGGPHRVIPPGKRWQTELLAMSTSAGELRRAPTACCIRCTFTAASFGSSRGMASRPRPTGQAGRISRRSRPGALPRYFCASRIRQVRTARTWRTVTFWNMRIPA